MRSCPIHFLFLLLFLDALRFNTDASVGGVEKLCVSRPIPPMGDSRPKLSVSDILPDGIRSDVYPPMGLLMVKGWTRCFAALCVMAHCFEEAEFYKAAMFLQCIQPFDS